MLNIIRNLITAIDQIIEWNNDCTSSEDYTSSPDGMKTMTATTMLLQALGEGIKKIDRVSNGQLLSLRPDIPWKDINEIGRAHV